MLNNREIIVNTWFAWYPVYTETDNLAWCRRILRAWNSESYLRIIDSCDRGMYEGAWVYYG